MNQSENNHYKFFRNITKFYWNLEQQILKWKWKGNWILLKYWKFLVNIFKKFNSSKKCGINFRQINWWRNSSSVYQLTHHGIFGQCNTEKNVNLRGWVTSATLLPLKPVFCHSGRLAVRRTIYNGNTPGIAPGRASWQLFQCNIQSRGVIHEVDDAPAQYIPPTCIPSWKWTVQN